MDDVSQGRPWGVVEPVSKRRLVRGHGPVSGWIEGLEGVDDFFPLASSTSSRPVFAQSSSVVPLCRILIVACDDAAAAALKLAFGARRRHLDALCRVRPDDPSPRVICYPQTQIIGRFSPHGIACNADQ